MTGLQLQIALIQILLGLIGVNCATDVPTLNPGESKVYKSVKDAFYITCYHPNATQHVWFDNKNQPINEGAKGRVYVEQSVGQGVALVFSEIQSSDQGFYTCKARVNNRDASSIFELSTFKPISFRDTPLVQPAELGKVAVIRCDVVGDPVPLVKWLINGEPPSSPKYEVLADGLYIKNVTFRDGQYSYVCRATQTSKTTSDMQMHKIKLDIQYAPKPPERGPQGNRIQVYGYLGGKTNITCEVDANPNATFKWFRNDRPVPQDGNTSIHTENNKSVLRLNFYNQSVRGPYQCIAENRVGALRRIYDLGIGPKPGTPSQATIQNRRHNSLELDIVGPHGTPDPKFKVTGYRVQILEKNEKERGTGWEWAREVELRNGQPFIIPDLTPNTDYVIRVTAQNAAGPGDFTKEIHGNTTSSGSSLHPFFNFYALIFVMLACKFT